MRHIATDDVMPSCLLRRRMCSLAELCTHRWAVWSRTWVCTSSLPVATWVCFLLNMDSSVYAALLTRHPLSPSQFPQPVVVASTRHRPRTCSAHAVRHAATTTARAPGAVTARTATTVRCPTRRLRPARVSPSASGELLPLARTR